jgi:hypothetical protein
MKKLLTLAVLLPVLVFLTVPAWAMNVMNTVEVISSQTVGSSATFTSDEIDLKEYTEIRGYTGLVYKVWGDGTADGKFEYLCEEDIDGTWIVPTDSDLTSSTGTGGTAINVIIASTNTSDSDENPHSVPFDISSSCDSLKIKYTNLSTISTFNVNTHLKIQ